MIENFNINKKLFFWINSFSNKNEILDDFFIFIAEYLIYIMVFIFFIYFAKQIWRDKKIEIKEIIFFFSAPVGAWLLTKIIKNLTQTERPFSYFKIETLIIHENVFSSFPSGHSTLAFALATSIWVYNKKIGWMMLAMAFLVALGRVLVGVHYPLDIFIGAIIGGGTVFIIGKYFKQKYKK